MKTKKEKIKEKIEALNQVKERLKSRGWMKGRRHGLNESCIRCSCLLGFLEQDIYDTCFDNPLYQDVVQICKNRLGNQVIRDKYNHATIDNKSPNSSIIAAVNNVLLESKKDVEQIFFKIEQQLINEFNEVESYE